MQQNTNTEQIERDPELWELAKKRAGFKSHFTTYLVMVPIFWIVWWLTDGKGSGSNDLPWAVWPTFGWGIGVFFHFLGTYVFHEQTSVQKEYDKLKRERNG